MQQLVDVPLNQNGFTDDERITPEEQLAKKKPPTKVPSHLVPDAMGRPWIVYDDGSKKMATLEERERFAYTSSTHIDTVTPRANVDHSPVAIARIWSGFLDPARGERLEENGPKKTRR